MPPLPDSLTLYLNGTPAATLAVGPSADQVTFEYLPDYRNRLDATPVSLALPLTRRLHKPQTASAVLWGLLSDNPAVLSAAAQQYQTSPRNLLGLLFAVGSDTAGAIRVLPPDTDPHLEGRVEWLSDDDLANVIVDVRNVAQTGAPPQYDYGRWSLAGAQGKVALHHDAENDRWGIPIGATPTTHILKPAVPGFDNFDVHEATAQRAAAMLGLKAAHSWILPLASSEPSAHVLVSERYDRVRDASGLWHRQHQEDLCQALGVPPARKYQSDGGPSLASIARLLDTHVHPATRLETKSRFVDALILNAVIGSTDGHAKNYSLRLHRDRVGLAPLYDVASTSSSTCRSRLSEHLLPITSSAV